MHILEEPITSYTLTGSNATFHCKTSAHEVYWRLNETFVSEHDWAEYGSEFHFKKEKFEPFFNLSLTITGTEQTNLTTIACDSYIGSNRETSHTATLYVFNTFCKSVILISLTIIIYFSPIYILIYIAPPPTPLITLQATNGNVQIDLSLPYRWLDLESSNYNISLFTANFLHIFSRFVTVTKKNISISIGQNDFITYSIEPCSKYIFEITTISPVFGLSQPSLLEFISPPSRESFMFLIIMLMNLLFTS